MCSDKNTNDISLISIVIPVFNEIESIELFIEITSGVLKRDPLIDFEFIFVNDGSTDGTLELLLSKQRSNHHLKIIELSRNFGKEAALTAGLHMAKGDIVVPIDVDLQDPPVIILEMIAKWREGYDVVLARRKNRDADSFLKRASAFCFYRAHNAISDFQLPENVGDFRLMDRCVVEALKELPESCRFMKGILAWLGFRTAIIDYVRPERAAGKTKFNAWKLWNFALEGITSFSTAPLRIWLYIGFIVSLFSFGFAFFILCRAVIFGIDVPGYASIIITIMFFGGLQLIGIGILGEYLGRTYIETKKRPIYIVRKLYQGNVEHGSQREEHPR